MDDKTPKIEIENGTLGELEISSVEKHLRIAKPKPKTDGKKNIIIPEEKNTKKQK